MEMSSKVGAKKQELALAKISVNGVLSLDFLGYNNCKDNLVNRNLNWFRSQSQCSLMAK